MNAVAYARFSSDNQREESLDAQLRAIQKYAKEHHLNIVSTYMDAAISGSTDERPQFQQMLSDAEQGKFDCIIVHKLDRFSRKVAHSLIYQDKLKRLGIKLLSVRETIDDSASGFLLNNIQGVISEYFLKNLSEEVRKGHMENAYKAIHNGGKPPYGYDLNSEKKLVINENEAAGVRLMFQMYGDGHGLRTICDTLNARGYRSKRGNPFSHTSLYDMLRNEKYIGVYVYNKRKDKHNKHSYNKDEDIIRVEGAIPAIISNDVWQKVLKRMEASRKGQNKAKRIYLLSGIIACGECGAAMVGHTAHNRYGHEYSNYRCNNKRTHVKCELPSVKKQVIEQIVIKELKQNIFSARSINKIAKQLYKKISELKETSNTEKNGIEALINKTTKEINNIVTAVANGWASEELREKHDLLKAEKARYESMLKNIELNNRLTAPTVDEIKAYILASKSLLDGTDEEKRKVIRTFVEKIIVYSDGTFKVQSVLDFTGHGLGVPGKTIRCKK